MAPTFFPWVAALQGHGGPTAGRGAAAVRGGSGTGPCAAHPPGGPQRRPRRGRFRYRHRRPPSLSALHPPSHHDCFPLLDPEQSPGGRGRRHRDRVAARRRGTAGSPASAGRPPRATPMYTALVGSGGWEDCSGQSHPPTTFTLAQGLAASHRPKWGPSSHMVWDRTTVMPH